MLLHCLLQDDPIKVTIMHKYFYLPAIAFACSTSAWSQQAAQNAPEAAEKAPSLELLNQQSKLQLARLKAELAEKRAQEERMRAELEFLATQQELKELKDEIVEKQALAKFNLEKAKIEREAELAKSKADLAESIFALQQTKWDQESEALEAEITRMAAKENRKKYSDAKPVYLEKPLQDDGTLVISDRRIPMNGPVTSDMANYITERIHFYNNKDKKMPIFIVINDSPGGSVMAGYRILKAMEGSDAPIHVVVKSFAASMAATITTLAEESYAYPNAIILHHQISSTIFYSTLNLTQQKEFFEDSKKWWKRLAGPLAKKMGISTEEFIKKMYEKNSDGDWVEFATEAQKLKWVNHIVKRIKETSQVVHPDLNEDDDEDDSDNVVMKLKETVDKDGKSCIFLPRLNPHDVYFLHNPDGYYRIKR